MTGLRLRPYQREALDAIEQALTEHSRVAAVLPTGAGKTVLFAHMAEKAHRQGRRALVLVHREELAEQAKDKIHSVAPDLSVGIVKAERNELDADIIIGSIQTLAHYRRREPLLDRNIGLIIADECHHAVARTWMEVLGDLGSFHPDHALATPTVGVTATLTRIDGKGLGDVWETVAYERDILWMIDNGYLTDVRGQAVTVDGLDLATVAKSRGDYQEGRLGEALEAAGADEVIAQAYLEHAALPDGQVRQGVLFAPTVATAYSFAETLTRHGITSATVEGNTSREDRELIYKRYRAGDIRVLSNAMVLTEGWDAPWCEVAVVARPTQSPGLYTQMVGRALRPWPGKTEALVLDVVGVTGRHKLQSLTDLVRTQVKEGESYAEARVRIEKEIQTGLKRKPAQAVGGVLAARQVELFASSHSVWLQTRRGAWFVPVKNGIFFLWPDEDSTYRLGYKQQRKQQRVGMPGMLSEEPRQNGWIQRGLTLEYAMAWGEQLAEEDDPTVSLRDRGWRRTKPSEAQVAFALKIKAVDPGDLESMRKGELSDRISIAVASTMLDR